MTWDHCAEWFWAGSALMSEKAGLASRDSIVLTAGVC